MIKFLVVCLALWVVGCAGSTEPLTVKLQTIRDADENETDDPMVRHEKIRRFHGAVSMEERRQRLGQYYTVLWNGNASAAKEIQFKFQQGKTGSRIKTMTRAIEPGTSSGKQEFAVIGDDYFENGRVVTWKIIFLEDGEVIATEQSYLWE
ncbi:MAG: hypothetical protein AB8D78_08710 [Akkermansiaceae bacterium]